MHLFDNPEISVVVVAYDGGHGGSVAKVTRAVYEAYFKDRFVTNGFKLCK